MENKKQLEELYHLLGSFYFAENDSQPPIFVQLVGWTNHSEQVNTTRKYVYVRKVPITLSSGLRGGLWRIDESIVKEYSMSVISPVKKPSTGIESAILISGGAMIRIRGRTAYKCCFDYAQVPRRDPPETPVDPPETPVDPPETPVDPPEMPVDPETADNVDIWK